MIELLSVFLPQPFIKPVLLFIIFTVVFFVVRHFFDPIYQKIKTAFQSQMGELSTLLDRDFIKISTEKLSKIFLGYYSFWFLSGTFLFFPHFLIGMVLGVLFVLAASRLPKVLVNGYHNRRVGRFGMQLVDALTLMSNGLRSGLNITQTIDLVSAEMSNPIAQEFRLIINETQLGTSVEESFENLATRIPTEDAEMLSTAISILRETGGNLAETFDTITFTIRERIKIKNKIGALVTQGIIQGGIIMAMPFGLAIMLYMIDPNQITPMFTTPLGLVMIGMMLILQLLGGFAIWRIIDIKV